MVRRRQLLEDALAEVLAHTLGDVMHDRDLGRCIAVPDDFDPSVRRLVSLWTIAERLEARLP